MSIVARLYALLLLAALGVNVANAVNFGIVAPPKAVELESLRYAKVSPTANLSADDIAKLPITEWTNQSNPSQVSLSPGVNWIQLTLYNPNQVNQPYYLTMLNKLEVKHALLYQRQPQLLTPLPFDLISTNYWVSHFVIKGNDRLELLLRVDSDIYQQLAITLSNHQEHWQTQSSLTQSKSFAIGGIVFVAAMFFLLFVTTRDVTLGYLSVYFVCRAAFLAAMLGSHLWYFFPSHSELRAIEIPWLVVASSICFLWFSAHLFKLKAYFPHFIRPLKILTVLYVAYIPISFYLSIHTNNILSVVIFIFNNMMLAALGLYLYHRKHKLALFYAIIMMIQLLFTVAVVLGFYSNMSAFADRHTLQVISFIFNAILVVLLICRQYYYQLADKHQMQREALANAVATKQAQDALIELQTQNQEELEQRVQERTLELNIALNELEELNHELAQKNTVDELTGLYNRRFYDQRLLAEYRRSKRNLTPLSLVVVDIDFFKQVNDNFGHLAGDQCLSWLAQHIKQSLKRSTDVGCRYGGEEFCLILPDTDLAGAIALAESLRVAIESFDFVYQGQHIALTISCGVTTYQQQSDITPQHIFGTADRALYQAKRGGRNQVKSLTISSELTIEDSTNG
ncbi:diguanylate cyclase [Thalassotalea euphylliae]|uniref:sensor domain-containing diguanylate cyclase n=1 Tax=Thalassotalea euphylliae TaxID=1655234 RepID=UPI003629C02F